MPHLIKRLFQNSVLGNTLYTLSHGRILKYPEDHASYIPDDKYFPFTPSMSSSSDDLKVGTTANTVVNFEGTLDPEDPHNWPWTMKAVVWVSTTLLQALLYIGSVAYATSKEQLMEEFSISETVALLPLTLYVIGYAVGPMIFSPLSEHAHLGRNVFYAGSLLLFALLQIPSALATNIAGFCILRFLSGLMISPVAATGGASFADMFTPPYVPLVMVAWGIGAYLGMDTGPLFGAIFEVKTHDWRWSCWFLLIFSGVLFVVFFTLVPETYGPTILYRKAIRLRRVTGNPNIDVTRKDSENIREILWRPIAIGFQEPVLVLINLYTALIYGVCYIWYESFPLVFGDLYGFSTMPLGVSYMSLLVGTIFGWLLYTTVIWHNYSKRILQGDDVITPEMFMPSAIVGSLFMPSGMFILGWTAAKDIHWIVPMIGAAVYSVSCIMLFQSLLAYVGMSFPRYVASAFASNSLVRSIAAGSFPLFGKALFKNLKNERFPVAWGSTLLGSISLLMVSIPVLFYLNGPKLRARSRYAGSD